MKKAFTLAETLIVLVVIGILASILLPTIKNITPDRNLMKFKKAHNTLGTAIRELVQSEEYYLNGDLTTKPNGIPIDGTHDGDNKYLCETMAQILNVKKVDCKDVQGGTGYFGEASIGGLERWTIEYAGEKFDRYCKEAQNSVGEEIVTADDIIFYDANPAIPFGISYDNYVDLQVPGQDKYGYPFYFKLTIGEIDTTSPIGNLPRMYKNVCFDIDGLNEGEDPFGYGVRYDGKIQAGIRAIEWLEKAEN